MQKSNIFDVLVVYTQSVATSASSLKLGNITPFSLSPLRQHYSLAYAYFLNECAKLGLKAALTVSNDIVGPGTCKSYWTYTNKNWHKVLETAFAPIIFDKVSPYNKLLKKKRELLFSSKSSVPFNDPYLFVLFNDKLKTFKRLRTFTLPTVSITDKSVTVSIAKLKGMISLLKNRNDFTSSFVLKDRFGASGQGVYKLGKNPGKKITEILKKYPKISFILQPFAKFSLGYSFNNIKAYTDIRIIYSQGVIVQRYIRIAEKNDFRCNEHQGGEVIYVEAKDIPQSVSTLADKILLTLDGDNALFALDFIVSNNGNAYFLEGNINPGIYWGLNSLEDKTNTRKLIKVIVGELKRRTIDSCIKPVITLSKTFISPQASTPIIAHKTLHI